MSDPNEVPLSDVPRQLLESQYLASQRHVATLTEDLARMTELQARAQSRWEGANARAAEVEREKASHVERELHAQAASQTLLLALDRMLALAAPTQEEHPAMFAAWEAARLARNTAPAVLSTPADRAVMLHLVRLIQDSPDVRYYVGGRGSRMRELLCAAIRASGFEGAPEEALQPSPHHADDETQVQGLKREIERLGRHVSRWSR